MNDKAGSPKDFGWIGTGLAIDVCLVTMVIIPLIAIVGLGALIANWLNIAIGLGAALALGGLWYLTRWVRRRRRAQMSAAPWTVDGETGPSGRWLAEMPRPESR